MPDNDKLFDATKTTLPIVVVAALVWFIASIVYQAGNKVGSSEKDQGYLTSSVDLLNKKVDDNEKNRKADHDELIELRTKLTNLKDYVDSVEASKNISITMEDPKKKGGK